MKFTFGKPPPPNEYRKRPSRWAPKSTKEKLRMSQSAYLQHKKDHKISLPEPPWRDADIESADDQE